MQVARLGISANNRASDRSQGELMANRWLNLLPIVALTFCWRINDCAAQDSFYRNKTVRIVVGGSAGGGYDTYTRTIARHLGKHVPGNPAFVVDNMTGAGSLIAANYTYKIAKPDGLTIGHFIGGLILQQVLGKPGIEFDGPKFEYLGVPAQDSLALGVSKAAGVSSIEQWLSSKTTLKFGGVGPGAGTDDVTKVVRATVGVPIQLISGYKGTADIRLAIAAGELHGVTNSWESYKSGWSKEIESGSILLLMQTLPQRHPELPNVPAIYDFVKNEEARKLVQVGIFDYSAIARPYVFPPKTPKDRVLMLRKGLAATYKDPEFLADVQKARLDMNPISGEDLEKVVARVYRLEKPIVEKLKEILLK
jgi:tripartite-type tricarboxylate transporter receptor subunit TctC